MIRNNDSCRSKYDSSSLINLNLAAKEAREIVPENKVKKLVEKYQRKIDQSEAEKQSNSKRTVKQLKNGQTEKSTHTVASSTLDKNQYDTINYSWAPLEIQTMIGEYLDLPTFNALFATSVEYRKNLDFAKYLQDKTLWDFAIAMAIKSPWKSYLLRSIIEAQIQNGDIESAKKTLLLIDRNHPMLAINDDFEDSLKKIIIANIERGNIATAEEDVLLLKDSDHKFEALIAIFKAKAKIGDKEGAEYVLSCAKDMVRSVPITNSFVIKDLNTIALAEAEIGKLEKARETFDLSKETASTVISFFHHGQGPDSEYGTQSNDLRKIALAELQAGCVNEAKNTLASAKELALQISQKSLKMSYLKEIILALIQAGDEEEAEEVKKVLISINEPSEKCDALREIATTQMNDNKEMAKKSLLSARDAALQISHVRFHRYVNLKQIAKMQAEAGDVSGAKETASMIENPQSRSLVFKEVALVQLKNNDEKAKETLASASSIALQIENADLQFRTLIEIAQAQAACDVSGAKNTIASAYGAITRENELTSLLDIVKIHAAIDNVEEVQKLFSEIREKALTKKYSEVPFVPHPLHRMAEVQIEIGDISGSKETLLLLKNQALLIEDSYTKLLKLTQIAAMQTRIEDVQEAKETLLLAKEMVLSIRDGAKAQSSALEGIARMQIQIEETQGAKETLLLAKETALSIVGDVEAKSSGLETIATMQAQIEDRQGAKETLLSAKETALSMIKDVKVKFLQLEKLATMQAQIGDTQGAKETLSDINKAEAFDHGVSATLKVLSILNKTK